MAVRLMWIGEDGGTHENYVRHVGAGESTQFTLGFQHDGGLPNTSVTWELRRGVPPLGFTWGPRKWEPGDENALGEDWGTVTPDGLYTAPSVLTPDNGGRMRCPGGGSCVLVWAISNDSTSTFPGGHGDRQCTNAMVIFS